MIDNIVISPHKEYFTFSDLFKWNEVIENITRVAKGCDRLINIVRFEEDY